MAVKIPIKKLNISTKKIIFKKFKKKVLKK